MKSKSVFYIVLLTGIFVGVSCNNNTPVEGGIVVGEPDVKDLLFCAKIEGNDWSSKQSYFTTESNRIEIKAVSENYEIITLILDTYSNSSTGTFSINDSNGIATYTGSEDIFSLISGTLTISKIENDKISGQFNFSAKSTSNPSKIIKITNGNFESIPKETKSSDKELIISITKQMSVNPDKGEIMQQNLLSTAKYSNNLFTLSYSDSQDKNLTVKISTSEKNGENYLLTADDFAIETISIDTGNKNQITLWYKNGNTLTLFQ